jgi:hypothetical protein
MLDRSDFVAISAIATLFVPSLKLPDKYRFFHNLSEVPKSYLSEY